MLSILLIIQYILAFVEQTWNIQAQSKHSNSISTQWPRFVLSNPRLTVTHYVVLCTSKADPRNITSSMTDGKGTSVTVGKLMPDTKYMVRVLAILSRPFSSNKINESIRASGEVEVRTKPQGK